MALITPNFNYVYPGLVTTEVFFKKSLSSPSLSDFAIIDPNVKFRKQYTRVPILSKILKPYTGCDRVFTDGFALDNVTLETKPFDVNLQFCKDEFTQQLQGKFNILAQEALKSGIDSFDITGTMIESIITEVLTDALRRDVFRRISFGDSTSGNADWNTIDGMWQRWIDTSGGSNYCVRRAGGALGTGALTAGQGIAILQAMWDASSNLLKGELTKMQFKVTGSIFDRYIKDLQGIGAGLSEQAYTATIDGIKTITFNGVPVIPVRLWDEDLNDPTNPLYAITRHLGVLTIKENHYIGTDKAGDLTKIQGWYDRETRRVKFEGHMQLGYQYLHCDYITIVY